LLHDSTIAWTPLEEQEFAMQDAWKKTMHIKAEHSESVYPSIYNADGDHVSFDEKSTLSWLASGPLYTVRVGEDIRCNVSPEFVTRFLAEKGVDASKFE
jgi:hypothetical protein